MTTETTNKDEPCGKLSVLNDLLYCRCSEKYSIERHGDGHAIYFGRCGHKHGANLAYLTGCNRDDIINELERRLNLSEKSVLMKWADTMEQIDIGGALELAIKLTRGEAEKKAI